MDVEGQEAANISCDLVGLAIVRPYAGISRVWQGIPRPPMIKTAGLSSPGIAMVEPERVLAWSNSAIVGLQWLTSGIDGFLHTQAIEIELKWSSFGRVCGMR